MVSEFGSWEMRRAWEGEGSDDEEEEEEAEEAVGRDLWWRWRREAMSWVAEWAD